MSMTFGSRRGVYIDITQELKPGEEPLSADEHKHFEMFDLIYRSLCALLFNYVPTSGHPGGSISSGRFVAGILFNTMNYDVSDPNREDADIISYSAGHKALGLYSMWALRNEVMRIGTPELLPSDERNQLRLEDLLGFRRNPVTNTPLFKKFNSKALAPEKVNVALFCILNLIDFNFFERNLALSELCSVHIKKFSVSKKS